MDQSGVDMLEVSPLWPAELDHIRLDSPNPATLVDFYSRALGMNASAIADGIYLLSAQQRRLEIGKGAQGAHPYSVFSLADLAQLARYRRYVAERGAIVVPYSSALVGDDAFAVRDPDDRLVVFSVRKRGGATTSQASAKSLAARLQHVVVASSRFPDMMAYYRDVLGFLISDTVHVDDGTGGLGDPNVCFFRGNEEHHCFAVFRAPVSSSDHHAYEVPGWSDVVRWADHFAALDVPIWWGPGRHGAGNNLFFMVKDPDGNNIEISADLERLPKGEPGKAWPAGGRALNLWGPVWVRDTATT